MSHLSRHRSLVVRTRLPIEAFPRPRHPRAQLTIPWGGREAAHVLRSQRPTHMLAQHQLRTLLPHLTTGVQPQGNRTRPTLPLHHKHPYWLLLLPVGWA